jgi:hypothetical protein
MKTIKILAPIILLLCMALSGCEKKPTPPTTDADGLPFATQIGANTLGCLIDGVPFSVSGYYSDWKYYGVEYTFGLDSILDIRIKSINPDKTINIRSKINGVIPGTFVANKYLDPNISFANLGGGVIPGSSGYFLAKDALASTITITKYQGGKDGYANIGDIISGTFDMILEDNTGKQIHISKARFDLKKGDK